MLTTKKGLGLFTFSLLFFLSPLWALSTGEAIKPFEVISQENRLLTEKDLWGKITVLFYDTRHTASVNNTLKYEIKDFREANLPLLENLQVVQVIDASSANFLTRTIWKRKLRENARRYGIDIYADWTGKMRRDFGFSPKESNILVIDQKGLIRFAHQGNPKDEERERLFKLLLELRREVSTL
ncbi:MAG: hypothetical protein N2Z84_03285 [Atribacterota bacterium]|nr:hypothetical protein [Atribacterota bacterium]